MHAQNKSNTVTGRVISTTGEPVAGATVLIKGTTKGTSTDNDGRYSIAAEKGATLIISSVNFESQQIKVGASNVINVSLTSLTADIGQVVVIGYGTQKKKDLTGSVVSVSAKTLQEVPANNAVSQLKGRTAGVSIVSNSGSVGSVPQIRIRGNRTLTTSNGASDNLDGPLFVVDGIPFGGINDLNPDDIVSMDILKDASATAIYGSRGAGGVIIITTKRGKVGKPVISYDGYYSTTSVMGKYNVYNGQEYAQLKADAAAYNRSSWPSSAGTSSYLLTQAEKDALAAGISTNWQDLIFKTGNTMNHQLSLQGGTEATQYSLGAGYFKETGIIPNQTFDRSTLRVTIDQKIGNRVKLESIA